MKKMIGMKKMIKNTWENNENAASNTKEIEVLKEHFPSCFKKNGTFDLERFKEYLNKDINVVNEGYEIKFLGKNYARLLVTLETETVIVPNEEHNKKEENKDSENIHITGDNLDALKHLLKSYSGKVKCIYIDPPYNTGSDGFEYNDNFQFSVEELTEKLSIGEEQAKRILDLTKRGSTSHSAWLMFMYPRLQLARDLISDDGVLFISIDDNELSNLKLLCDDIFGEENFIANFIRESRTNRENRKIVSTRNDYLLCYSRDFDPNHRVLKQLPMSEKALKNYKNPDNDKRGLWKSDPATAQAGHGTKDQFYVLTAPNGKKHTLPSGRCWLYTEKVMKKYSDDGRIWFGRDGNGVPRVKTYLNAKERGLTPESIWFSEDISTNELAKNHLKNIFDGYSVFDTPKPVELLKRVMQLSMESGDIILDFFSGSSTTAQAVLELNSLENSNFKFIQVQLPEQLKKSDEAYKIGYSTIDEVGRDRIIRVAKEIKKEKIASSIDLGFKHFTLKEPKNEIINKLVEFNPNEDKLFADKTLLDEFGVPTIMTTWLNNDGYGLTTDTEKMVFGGYTTYYKNKHLYLVHPELRNETIEEIVVKYETDGNFNAENIVLFGYSFTWTELEALKTNLSRLQDTEKNLRINFDVRY